MSKVKALVDGIGDFNQRLNSINKDHINLKIQILQIRTELIIQSMDAEQLKSDIIIGVVAMGLLLLYLINRIDSIKHI